MRTARLRQTVGRAARNAAKQLLIDSQETTIVDRSEQFHTLCPASNGHAVLTAEDLWST
jgi:hypothetical protein